MDFSTVEQLLVGLDLSTANGDDADAEYFAAVLWKLTPTALKRSDPWRMEAYAKQLAKSYTVTEAQLKKEPIEILRKVAAFTKEYAGDRSKKDAPTSSTTKTECIQIWKACRRYTVYQYADPDKSVPSKRTLSKYSEEELRMIADLRSIDDCETIDEIREHWNAGYESDDSDSDEESEDEI